MRVNKFIIAIALGKATGAILYYIDDGFYQF